MPSTVEVLIRRTSLACHWRRGIAPQAHRGFQLTDEPVIPPTHLAFPRAERRTRDEERSLIAGRGHPARGLAWPARAVAQDAHYWTYGYGPVGQLTEGTLVGGVERPLGRLLQPRGPRAPRRAAVRHRPHLDRAREHRRARTRRARTSTSTRRSSTSCPSMVAGHVGGNDGQTNHFAFAFLSRHDSDWDLGYSDVEVSAASPDGSAGFGRVPPARSSSTGSGGTWSHRARTTGSRSASRPSSPTAPSAAGARSTLEELSAGASGAALRRQRERVQPRARSWPRPASPGGPGRWELGRHGDRARASSSGATASRSSTPSVAGVASAPVPLREHPDRARRRRTTRPGRWPAARPGAAAATAVHTTVEWFSAVDRVRHPGAGAGARRGQLDDRSPSTFRGEAAERRELRRSASSSTSASGVMLYGGVARNESA